MPLLYKRFVEVQLPKFTVNALKIAFDVSRQPDESHVNGEVAIYNLTKDRENAVEDRGGAVSLRAGYGAPSRTDEGAQFVSFLNPLAKVGGILNVDSSLDGFTGRWKIAGVQHQGDNWKGQFKTVMDARRIRQSLEI